MAPSRIFGRYYSYSSRYRRGRQWPRRYRKSRYRWQLNCEPVVLLDYRAAWLPSYTTTKLPSYRAIGSQHSPAGRWLFIDILTVLNRARIIRRAIDGIVGLLAHLVERF